mgnify:FL=1
MRMIELRRKTYVVLIFICIIEIKHVRAIHSQEIYIRDQPCDVSQRAIHRTIVPPETKEIR